ncbi:hypothetical protein L1887_38245 [Cichorium endivia]|nr:hypothetical protein L1887_38245 [Cichorium endivia]
MILSSSSLITTPIAPPQIHPSLHLLSKCKNMEEFKQIHAQMIKNGLHKSQFALSKILHFCAIDSGGDLSYALSVFNTIEEPPDPIIWNTIIRGYSLNSSPFSAIDFYKFMLLSGVEPNSYTFPSLIKSCARIDGITEGKQIHGHVLKLGLGCDAFIHTSLINFYSQSGQLDDARLVFDKSPLRDAVSFTALITGYIAQERSKDARKLFDEMPVRDVVSWNSIIAGHTRTKRFQDAIDLFKEMQTAKVKPNESTLVTVLSACAQSGCLTTGEHIKTMIIHHELGSNLRLLNALIDMYSKCNELTKARTLFDSINNKNIITWNLVAMAD